MDVFSHPDVQARAAPKASALAPHNTLCGVVAGAISFLVNCLLPMIVQPDSCSMIVVVQVHEEVIAGLKCLLGVLVQLLILLHPLLCVNLIVAHVHKISMKRKMYMLRMHKQHPFGRTASYYTVLFV